MTINTNDLLNSILDSLSRIDHAKLEALPDINLYMDQVITFMEKELYPTKRHEEDPILTKTMVNNYVKNNLLPPPEKKKYSKEHILTLVFIYYFKSVLSISDIQNVLNPLTDRYFGKKSSPTLEEIYDGIFCLESHQVERLKEIILQPGDRAGLFQMGALEPLVTTDGLGHQGAVQQNAPVVDALVEMVVLPLLLGDRETGQSLLDGHLRLYIPEVVGFEGGPLLRRVCRKAAKGGAIPGLRRCAEIAHQVFALLEFLLLQAQHGAGPLQREGQTQGSRPHHGAVPGVGVQVLSDRVPQVPGETHPLELCVEGPLGHRRVCQRSQHIGGDAFADGEIHHPDGAAVHGIAEQQHFKLRDLAVAVHAALGQRLRGKGFNIDG